MRGRGRQQTDSEIEGASRLGSKDLVVVSAYRPNKATKYTGSVWQQHRIYWTEREEETDPREKFTADLKELVSGWRAEGCEVIVGIDVNGDVPKLAVGSFRQHMQEVGLHEAILASHHGPYPATQNRNLTDTPIDGIFVSSGVSVKASGYLEFHQYFQSDHRGLWIDIDLKATLGGYRQSEYTISVVTSARHVMSQISRLT